MQAKQTPNGASSPLPRYFIWAIVLFIGLIASLRVYFEQVPRGAQFEPFYFNSFPAQPISLSNGKTLQVYFNDAGAAHSGNHWTWIVASDWITGRRVVAQGYVSSDVRMGNKPLPISRDDDVLTITFLRGRRSGESDTVTTRVDLKSY